MPLPEEGSQEKETMGQQQLLTVEETAKMLRLKGSTVRAWILQRRIPYVKMGRLVFIRESAAQAVIDSSIVYPAQRAA